jgi:prolyl-tRNA synthetase
MFADWELIGIPQRVVLSDRGLKDGTVELQGRCEAAAARESLAGAVAAVRRRLAAG